MLVSHLGQSDCCQRQSGGLFNKNCLHQKLIFILKHSEAALATLKSIHQINVLHGDIRRQNILVGNSRNTIIDFAYSRPCRNQLEKKEEYQQLHSLLDMV